MNPDLRNRVVLPILLPLGILGAVAVGVGGIAVMLLFTTRVLALTIAVVIASGVMVAMSLASSIDEKDATVARKGVIGLVALLPVVLGASVSLWSANGGVPAEDLNWNRLPHILAPEGAVVGAQNSQSFCDYDEETGDCTDTDALTLPAQPESESFLFLFENLESGVAHNFSIFELAGSESAPEPGAIVFGVAEGSEIVTGVTEKLYEVVPNEFEAGDQFYYNCVVHPAMDGVLSIVEADAPAA